MIGRGVRRAAGWLGIVGALAGGGAGCGGGTPPVTMDDAGPGVLPASTANVVAFEGQPRFVTVLEASGADWSGTMVRAAAGSPFEIVEQRCAGSRCALVARVRDETPNRGIVVPAPIDASNHYFEIESGGQMWRALVSVQPLDALSASGEPARVRGGALFGASAESDAAAPFVAGPSATPMRWVIFGDATLTGGIDFSATGAIAGPGGAAGGAAGLAGEGDGGGMPGLSGAGAGGGGGALAGSAGQGADGTAGAGGAGGAASTEDCAADFFATSCGGAGGGGSTGAGGGGGGSVALIVLGSLSIGPVRASGGDGADGGGGGGGGRVLVAASSLDAVGELDVGGGAGGAVAGGGVTGGTGGAGDARIDAITTAAVSARRGPAVDVGALTLIVSGETLRITGVAAPMASVRLEREAGGVAGMGDADAEGRFAIDAQLELGLNRLRVLATLDGTEVRSFVGTSLELERGAGPTPLPTGALLDIARVE